MSELNWVKLKDGKPRGEMTKVLVSVKPVPSAKYTYADTAYYESLSEKFFFTENYPARGEVMGVYSWCYFPEADDDSG